VEYAIRILWSMLSEYVQNTVEYAIRIRTGYCGVCYQNTVEYAIRIRTGYCGVCYQNTYRILWSMLSEYVQDTVEYAIRIRTEYCGIFSLEGSVLAPGNISYQSYSSRGANETNHWLTATSRTNTGSFTKSVWIR
jgi:hypothetical protein